MERYVAISVVFLLAAAAAGGILAVKMKEPAVSRPSSPLPPVQGLAAGASLEVSAAEPEQGDTLVFSLRGTATPPSEATFGKVHISFFPVADRFLAIYGIDVKANAGTTTLALKFSSGEELRHDVFVRHRAFPTVALAIPPPLARRGVTGEQLAESIQTGDKPKLDTVFQGTTSEVYFTKSFQNPLARWIDVGRFGIIRASREGSIRHLGVDLEASVGEAVHAVNDGVVKFVNKLPNFGTVVVVDHGLGIYSAYLHLSEAGVSLNQPVGRGEVIGKTGESGEYVLEPHLHLSIRVMGASVDPRRFLDAVNSFLPSQ